VLGDLGMIFASLGIFGRVLVDLRCLLEHRGGVLEGLGQSFGCLLEHLGSILGGLGWTFEWSSSILRIHRSPEAVLGALGPVRAR